MALGKVKTRRDDKEFLSSLLQFSRTNLDPKCTFGVGLGCFGGFGVVLVVFGVVLVVFGVDLVDFGVDFVGFGVDFGVLGLCWLS